MSSRCPVHALYLDPNDMVLEKLTFWSLFLWVVAGQKTQKYMLLQMQTFIQITGDVYFSAKVAFN